MSASGCILYLMPSDMIWLDSKLEKAQQHALKGKLPLAVVTCILPAQYSEMRLHLLSIETALSAYGIPFVILLGGEAQVLPTFVKNVRPVHVYGHGGDRSGSVRLTPHPYKWLGSVIQTKELQKIVDKQTHM